MNFLFFCDTTQTRRQQQARNRRASIARKPHLEHHLFWVGGRFLPEPCETSDCSSRVSFVKEPPCKGRRAAEAKHSEAPTLQYVLACPQAVQNLKSTYERFQNHTVELKYADNVAPVIRKAFATFCEIIFASLLSEEQVSASERRNRISSQLKKLETMESEWGEVQSLMHPRLLSEAASVSLAP